MSELNVLFKGPAKSLGSSLNTAASDSSSVESENDPEELDDPEADETIINLSSSARIRHLSDGCRHSNRPYDDAYENNSFLPENSSK